MAGACRSTPQELPFANCAAGASLSSKEDPNGQPQKFRCADLESTSLLDAWAIMIMMPFALATGWPHALW